MEENKHNKRLHEVIELIQTNIEGTQWDGHVFAYGGFLRDLFIGNDANDLNLVINIPNKSNVFATWLTNKLGIFESSKNPKIDPIKKGTSFRLTNTEYKDITITCHSTQYYGEYTKALLDTDDIKIDAESKDFTCNALYLDLSTGNILDPTEKGSDDIGNFILRTPKDPLVTFQKDPLRIIRAARIKAETHFGFEKNTWFAMIEHAHLLSRELQNDKRAELEKLLMCSDPYEALMCLYHCGALTYICPELRVLSNLHDIGESINLFEHTAFTVASTQPNLINRYAALFHDIGKIATAKGTVNNPTPYINHHEQGYLISLDILRRMMLPQESMLQISSIIRNIGRFAEFDDEITPSTKCIKKFIDALDKDFDIALDVLDADNKAREGINYKPNQVSNIRKQIDAMDKKNTASVLQGQLPINGNDIKEILGIKKSPKIGTYLKMLTEAFTKKEMTKEECVEFVKNAVIQ